MSWVRARAMDVASVGAGALGCQACCSGISTDGTVESNGHQQAVPCVPKTTLETLPQLLKS